MAGALRRLEDGLDRLAGRAEVGREPALVADGRRQAAVVQMRLQGMEGLGSDPQRLGEGLGSGRHDHELLQVDRVLRVDAAVDDVHHRDREDVSVGAADVAVERKARLRRRGSRHRERGAEDGVRAQVALVLGAVKLDERSVHAALIRCIHALERGGDRRVHVADGGEDALAAVALLVAVSQLDGLVRAGRRSGRNGRPAAGAGHEHGLHLDGGVAARVEDLPAVQRFDVAHGTG